MFFKFFSIHMQLLLKANWRAARVQHHVHDKILQIIRFYFIIFHGECMCRRALAFDFVPPLTSLSLTKTGITYVHAGIPYEQILQGERSSQWYPDQSHLVLWVRNMQAIWVKNAEQYFPQLHWQLGKNWTWPPRWCFLGKSWNKSKPGPLGRR